jgi:capsular polysaccharide biosynthesis protein
VAVQVETQGQLQEFLEILGRRKWQVLLPAAAVLALGVFVAVVVPKKFVARTQVELRPVGVSISPKEAANAPFQIKALSRIKKVVQDLQNREYLALPPEDQVDWLLKVQKNLKVTIAQSSQQGTSFVDVEFSDVQREWAADFLRALRNDWIQDVVQRDRRKSEDELSKLREARGRLESRLTREEEQLTDLLRSHGLSATQPAPGADASRSEDPVFERLKRNEAELEAAESTSATLEVRIDAMNQRLGSMPPRLELGETVVGGVSNQEELDGIERQIQELQAQLQGIRPQHSRYKQIQDHLHALEDRRGQLTRLITKGELQRNSAPNPELAPLRQKIEEAETDLRVARARAESLRGQIETDRARVAELQDVYREVRERKERIARLSTELADAESVYQRKSREVEQLQSPLANPFEITQEVDVPTKPTEPNPWLIVGFAGAAGLGLGLALALFLEFSRSSFRSVADIARVMAVPVLGSAAPITTRRERRLAAARRVVVAVSSVVFVGAVLFVTWAWANDAKYLSQDLRDAIEGLRARLK